MINEKLFLSIEEDYWFLRNNGCSTAEAIKGIEKAYNNVLCVVNKREMYVRGIKVLK